MAKKKANNIEEVKKSKAIGPFDIIKLMFTDKEGFDGLSDILLSKNFFMINRIMSIRFPLQAECFNKVNINTAQVIRSWQQFATASLGYGRVPAFVYTKGSKAAQSLSEDSTNLSPDEKIEYCKQYNITLKELDEMLLFSLDATLAHINQYKELTKNRFEKI